MSPACDLTPGPKNHHSLNFPHCPPQKEDLARMFRLFGRIPKGLEPMAAIFKDFVESEGRRGAVLLKQPTIPAGLMEDKAPPAGQLLQGV